MVRNNVRSIRRCFKMSLRLPDSGVPPPIKKMDRRLFLPSQFIALVHPQYHDEGKNGQVVFDCPFKMTKVEIKQYLTSIYNVPVDKVDTRVLPRRKIKINGEDAVKGHVKRAYVTLTPPHTFTYPEDVVLSKAEYKYSEEEKIELAQKKSASSN